MGWTGDDVAGTGGNAACVPSSIHKSAQIPRAGPTSGTSSLDDPC
jgi:hypothetical protein